jgi:DNA-binding CsgD family transcriptional regulator
LAFTHRDSGAGDPDLHTSEAEQRRVWMAEAAEVLSGRRAVDAMIAAALAPTVAPVQRADASCVTQTADHIVAVLVMLVEIVGRTGLCHATSAGAANHRGRDCHRPNDRLPAARAPAPVNPLADLSEREREVLALIAEGLSNRAIAARLFVRERTVEAHVTQIFWKLQLPESPRPTPACNRGTHVSPHLTRRGVFRQSSGRMGQVRGCSGSAPD